jgi:hypothetical protein
MHKSAMPVWSPTGLVPRPLMVRCFLVRHEGTYVPMPGGMTRVSADDTGIDISMQRGGAAKDTWVIERELAPIVVGTRAQAAREPLRRSAGELQSRVADNLFWLGRYAERLDNAARLMRASLMRVPAGGASARELAEFQALARMLGDRGLVAPGMRADLTVIDFDALSFDAPRMAFDLPAGGRRLVQRAKGYRATFVAGEQTVADDAATGALPGRLLRGPR